MVTVAARLVPMITALAAFIVLSATSSPWYLFGVAWMVVMISLGQKRFRTLRRRRHLQVLRSGDGSRNVQAGRDVNLR